MAENLPDVADAAKAGATAGAATGAMIGALGGPIGFVAGGLAGGAVGGVVGAGTSILSGCRSIFLLDLVLQVLVTQVRFIF